MYQILAFPHRPSANFLRLHQLSRDPQAEAPSGVEVGGEVRTLREFLEFSPPFPQPGLRPYRPAQQPLGPGAGRGAVKTGSRSGLAHGPEAPGLPGQGVRTGRPALPPPPP